MQFDDRMIETLSPLEYSWNFDTYNIFNTIHHVHRSFSLSTVPSENCHHWPIQLSIISIVGKNSIIFQSTKELLLDTASEYSGSPWQRPRTRRQRERYSRARMELRGTKEVQITSRRRRLKSRDQHLFLLSSLCVPTVRAHTFGYRTPRCGYRQRLTNVFLLIDSKFQNEEKKKKRKRTKDENNNDVSQSLVRTKIVSSWRPVYCFFHISHKPPSIINSLCK